MNNKIFSSQSNPDSPNYGRIFRDETQRRVHCPDLEIEQDLTIDVVYNGGSIILILLIILLLMGAFS